MGQRGAGGGALGLPAIARFVLCLPPREGFGPGRAGAIGMIARRLADADTLVVGGPQAGALFEGVAYAAAPPAWFGLSHNARYAAGVARLLRRAPPALIEQYNRPLVALRLAARLAPTPVVLCLQNDPQAMRGYSDPAARRRLLDGLAGAVVASDWLAARLLEGIADPPRPVHVLPNCLDLLDIPPIAPPGARSRVLLFAGRLVADKGADTFVAACARALPRLPGWGAAMIGADRFGPDSPETPFLRALRPQAAAAGVTLAGYRPHADVLAAMARAAVVAVPSRWQEPFGLTALEALACGAALVCSRRGGLPEIAGDAALYADPDDPDALAEAMVALATDEPARAARAAAGLARAARFGVPDARARLAEIRADILHRWSAAV
jgi:glycosyltransferase involved in cell wall biosynthesis